MSSSLPIYTTQPTGGSAADVGLVGKGEGEEATADSGAEQHGDSLRFVSPGGVGSIDVES